MAKPLHKFRMDRNHKMYIDDKPLKGVQAMQLTMDIRNPTLAMLNLVMLVPPPELEHDKVEATVEAPVESTTPVESKEAKETV